MMAVLDNVPDFWRAALPIPAKDGHKYHRGHTAILGSDDYTGATRLAAEACSRVGSGLVTVLSDKQADTYRTTLPPDIMVRETDLQSLNRPSVLLAGPGGCSEDQAASVIAADPRLKLVLDADAIRLWPQLTGRTLILTPHEGEFERYFPEHIGEPTVRAAAAAKASGAILVLKRPETVIAAPDGRVALNRVSSPYLAKAGTGDVLAGLIAGLVAQGMPASEAACAGVWFHGRAAQEIGPGLIPQDLFPVIRGLLRDLLG